MRDELYDVTLRNLESLVFGQLSCWRNARRIVINQYTHQWLRSLPRCGIPLSRHHILLGCSRLTLGVLSVHTYAVLGKTNAIVEGQLQWESNLHDIIT